MQSEQQPRADDGGGQKQTGVKLTSEFVRLKRETFDLFHQAQHNGLDCEQLMRKLVENKTGQTKRRSCLNLRVLN